MANHILIDEDIAQLLQEADCPDEFIQQFLVAMEAESVKNQLSLLRTQRSRQLNRLHEEEKKLDRLDYLGYAPQPEKRWNTYKSGRNMVE